MTREHMTIAVIYGLFGFVCGLIVCGYAKADSNSACSAVSQAYTIAHSHYRSRTNLTPIGLYESEIAGIDLANDVAETFNVSCEVYP